ncbi:MAG: acyltransferase [Gemmatimonadetes bacterium]|nr:acyltransferase [Gemmatimonadota bacterium]
MIRSLVFIAGLVGRTTWSTCGLVFAWLRGVPPGPGSIYEQVPRDWVRGLLRAARIEVRVRGGEHVEGLGTCVYCANHVSAVDPGALLEALPGSVRFVAKRSLFHVPVFGTALKLSGQIPVDRSNRDAAMDAFSEATRILKDGVSAAIFVEGTRSRDGRLQPFKKGAFVLAINLQVPCVPVYLAGTRPLMRPGELAPRPGTVEVRIGEAIPTTGLNYEDRDALRERCWQAMSALAAG